MKKMSNVLMSSSLTKIVSHVWAYGVEKGDGLGEEMRSIAFWKRGNLFSKWDQSGVKFITSH